MTTASLISQPGGIRNNYIVQAWLVLLLALIFGGLLASVQITLSPIIEENKINETRSKVPELVLGVETAENLFKQGKSLDIIPHTVTVKKGVTYLSYKVFKAEQAGETCGWVVKTKGQGYADKVELLVGFDSKIDTITGLFILDQKETPGLGNKITEWEWRKQFIAKKTNHPLTVVKSGATAEYHIDAIGGATISSVAVCNIINSATADVKPELSAGNITSTWQGN